jgi:hypothetical protein
MAGTRSTDRIVASIVLVALLLGIVALTPRATMAAGPTTRRAQILVGAETLTVEVVVNSNKSKAIYGPIRLVVTLPAETSGSLVAADQGFNGYGWAVRFRRGDQDGVGHVAVTVPSRGVRVATEVDLSSDSGWAYGVPGSSNTATIIEFYPTAPGLPGPVAVSPQGA